MNARYIPLLARGRDRLETLQYLQFSFYLSDPLLARGRDRLETLFLVLRT